MADDSSGSLEGKNLSNLRVVDLKMELEKRGLSKSGSKKELVKRLKQKLELEKLYEEASTVRDTEPKLHLDEATEQNEFVKQYLADQQKKLRQMELKRLIELRGSQSVDEDEETDSDFANKDPDSDEPSVFNKDGCDSSVEQNIVSSKEQEEAEIEAAVKSVTAEPETDQYSPEEKPVIEMEVPSPEVIRLNEIPSPPEEVVVKDIITPPPEVVVDIKEIPSPPEVIDVKEIPPPPEVVGVKVITSVDVKEIPPPPEVVDVKEILPPPEVVDVKEIPSPPEVVDVREILPLPEVIDLKEIPPPPEVVDVKEIPSPEVNAKVISSTPEVVDVKEIPSTLEVVDIEDIPTPEVVGVKEDTPPPEVVNVKEIPTPAEGAAMEEENIEPQDLRFVSSEPEVTKESVAITDSASIKPKINAPCSPPVMEPEEKTSESKPTSSPESKPFSPPESKPFSPPASTEKKSKSKFRRRRSKESPANLSSEPDVAKESTVNVEAKKNGEEASTEILTNYRKLNTIFRERRKEKSKEDSTTKTVSSKKSKASLSISTDSLKSILPKKTPPPVEPVEKTSESKPFSPPASAEKESKSKIRRRSKESPTNLSTEPEVIKEPVVNVKVKKNGDSSTEVLTNFRKLNTIFFEKQKSKDDSTTKKIFSSKMSKASLSISTDSLKSIIPDINTAYSPPVVESVEKESKPYSPIEKEAKLTVMRRSKESPPNETKVDDPWKRNKRQVIRESSIEKTEAEGGHKRIVLPEKPPSNVLFIQNLVRPFTLLQLKHKLKETGEFIEEEFWIDKIKSKCFVTYENEEEATKTLAALHDKHWPLSNPKSLSVEYSSKEEMEHFKKATEQPKTAAPVVHDAPPIQQERRRSFHSPENNPETVELPRKKEPEGKDHSPKRRERPRFVREWDRDKVTLESPERDRDRERRRPPRRSEEDEEMSHVLERRREKRGRPETPPRERVREAKEPPKKKKEEEAPAKLLDDLFQKTKTTPCIYWLPLTEAQVKDKEEQRKTRRLEREKRHQEEENERMARRRQRERVTRSRSRSPARRR